MGNPTAKKYAKKIYPRKLNFHKKEREPHAENAKNAENPSVRARKGDGGREGKSLQKAFFNTMKRGDEGKQDENRTGATKSGFLLRISHWACALVASGFTVIRRGHHDGSHSRR